MVNFAPVAVPRLRLPTDQFGQPTPYRPIENRKLPFDIAGHQAPYTPKIGSPTGSDGTAEFARARIPGYSGHVPGVISKNPSGKTFGYLTKMDRDELDLCSPIGFAKSASPGPWASTYRRNFTEDGPRPEPFAPPRTARDPSRTREEDRTLQAKFRRRRRDGERELHDMRLASPLPTQREIRLKPSWVVECGWITPRTNRVTRPDADIAARPCSPEGRRPDRQDSDWKLCAGFLIGLGYPDSLNAEFDKTYRKSDPDRGYAAGELYETPKGWLGFGLRVAETHLNKNVFQHWQTVYYPCPAEYLSTILATLECVMPGDKLVSGKVTKTCYMKQRDGTEKRDPHTPRKLGSTTRICTTPSIRYALLKLNAMTRNGGFAVHGSKKLFFILQCKQMGGALNVGGYHRTGEQIGWADSMPTGTRISPYFLNEEIENYALRRSSVVPYRLLVKVEEATFMPAMTSTGDALLVPEQSHKEIKWDRNLNPAYASQTLPGLQAPFAEFADPAAHKTRREGGYECPKPSAPYLTFPEKSPMKEKDHPTLRASTQPDEPQALVKPSSGWLEGLLPPAFLNPSRNIGRCVAGVMKEMKEKFAANPKSLSNLFSNLAHTGDGRMHKSDLAIILVRLNIIKGFDDPIMEELWQSLDSKQTGSVSPEDFAAKFGLLGGSEAVMDVLKMKIGARFSKIGRAFRQVDEDKSGTIEKQEFVRLMTDFNLLDGFPAGSEQEIWDLLDRDKSGSLTYDEFVEKFSGGDDIQTHYGPASGTRVEVRKHYHTEGTKAYTVASICDEGTACYAQQDFDKAEACYRRVSFPPAIKPPLHCYSCTKDFMLLIVEYPFQALALDPQHVASLCCLAWLLLTHKNDVLGARGLMQRAHQTNPHHPYVVWQKGYHLNL